MDRIVHWKPESIIPAPYRWDPPKAFYEILANWLEIEVNATAEVDMPLLRELAGHRRRDVIAFYDRNRDRFDRDIAMKLYGACTIENVRWPQ